MDLFPRTHKWKMYKNLGIYTLKRGWNINPSPISHPVQGNISVKVCVPFTRSPIQFSNIKMRIIIEKLNKLY